MDDNDSIDDTHDDLMWFYYGYLFSRDEQAAKQDTQGENFGCLATIVVVLCIGLGAFTQSIVFPTIVGIVGMVLVWKLIYGKSQD